MATLMWIQTKDKPYIISFERKMLPNDALSLLKLKGMDAPRYLIAKGNIIEGTKARW